MSKYRFARIIALVVSIFGWLHIAVVVLVAAYSLLSPAGVGFLELAAMRFALVVAAGSFLVLAGSVAQAIFDIADAVHAGSGDASLNNSSKRMPLRGTA